MSVCCPSAKGYTLFNIGVFQCAEPVENRASPVPIPHMEYPMPPCDHSLAASLKGTVTSKSLDVLISFLILSFTTQSLNPVKYFID